MLAILFQEKTKKMLVFPKNAEKNASTIEKGLSVTPSFVSHFLSKQPTTGGKTTWQCGEYSHFDTVRPLLPQLFLFIFFCLLSSLRLFTIVVGKRLKNCNLDPQTKRRTTYTPALVMSGPSDGILLCSHAWQKCYMKKYITVYLPFPLAQDGGSWWPVFQKEQRTLRYFPYNQPHLSCLTFSP